MKTTLPKVEHGIPIPPKRNSGITGLLRTLKIGDSVLIKGKSGQVLCNTAQATFGSGNYATRSTNNGVRVWRLK